MIIPREFPDFDSIVTISLVTFFVFFYFSEIPVRHIYPSSWSEKLSSILQYLDSLFQGFEMMKRGKKNKSIELQILRHNISNIDHIDNLKMIFWMEFSRFSYHSFRAIDPEILEFFSHYSFFTFNCQLFEKSTISTANIEHTLVSLISHIENDRVELWPVEILATIGKCDSKIIVGHRLYIIEK